MRSKTKLILLFSLALLSFTFEKTGNDEGKKLKKADKAFKRADYLRSFTLYDEVLRSNPGHAHATYHAGLSLFNIDKGDTSALSYFKRSAAQYVDAHYYMGRIHQLKGESRKAL